MRLFLFVDNSRNNTGCGSKADPDGLSLLSIVFQ